MTTQQHEFEAVPPPPDISAVSAEIERLRGELQLIFVTKAFDMHPAYITSFNMQRERAEKAESELATLRAERDEWKNLLGVSQYKTTKEFTDHLMAISKDIKQHPEKLIPLKEVIDSIGKQPPLPPLPEGEG